MIIKILKKGRSIESKLIENQRTKNYTFEHIFETKIREEENIIFVNLIFKGGFVTQST